MWHDTINQLQINTSIPWPTQFKSSNIKPHVKIENTKNGLPIHIHMIQTKLYENYV
jgi:hypothetical protein